MRRDIAASISRPTFVAQQNRTTSPHTHIAPGSMWITIDVAGRPWDHHHDFHLRARSRGYLALLMAGQPLRAQYAGCYGPALPPWARPVTCHRSDRHDRGSSHCPAVSGHLSASFLPRSAGVHLDTLLAVKDKHQNYLYVRAAKYCIGVLKNYQMLDPAS